MAGRSHWSASIMAREEDTHVTFDVACRVASKPVWLGSSYRWFAPTELQFLEAIQISPLSAILKPVYESTVVVEPDPSQENSKTIRWSYAICRKKDNRCR